MNKASLENFEKFSLTSHSLINSLISKRQDFNFLTTNLFALNLKSNGWRIYLKPKNKPYSHLKIPEPENIRATMNLTISWILSLSHAARDLQMNHSKTNWLCCTYLATNIKLTTKRKSYNLIPFSLISVKQKIMKINIRKAKWCRVTLAC